MIPKTDDDLLTLEVETQPSLTYALDIEHGRIRGMVDNLESLRDQALYYRSPAAGRPRYRSRRL